VLRKNIVVVTQLNHAFLGGFLPWVCSGLGH
jgi:hypothetical protein